MQGFSVWILGVRRGGGRETRQGQERLIPPRRVGSRRRAGECLVGLLAPWAKSARWNSAGACLPACFERRGERGTLSVVRNVPAKRNKHSPRRRLGGQAGPFPSLVEKREPIAAKKRG